MIQLTRGRAEIQSISFETDPEAFRELRIRYKQHGRILLEKGKEDVSICGSNVEYQLTPEETARFNPYDPVYIQIWAEPETGPADYTDVIEADVVDVL